MHITTRNWLTLAATLAVAGCEIATSEPESGLQGLVSLGPITPVCLPDIPCEQPVASTFEVRLGDRLVTRFRSDAHGLYRVHLPLGTYRIAPPLGGPIPFPESQALDVTVGPGPRLTPQDLHYSTGLRIQSRR